MPLDLPRAVVALAVLSAGCGRVWYDPLGRADGGGSDGETTTVDGGGGLDGAPSDAPEIPDGSATPDAPVVADGGDPLSCTLGPFAAPVPLDPVNSTFNEHSPTMSADGLTIVFASKRTSTGEADLFISTRPDHATPFSEPVLIDAASSPADESGTRLSPDGLRLYFHSLRDGFEQAYIATRGRVDVPFGAAVPLAGLEGMVAMAPTPSADELTLFFTAGWRTTGELMVATRPAREMPFTVVGPIESLDSAGWDYHASFSVDLREVFFASDRDALGVDLKIYRATRPSTDLPFATPTLITEIDSGYVSDPEISHDGRTLLFIAIPGSSYDIFVATRGCL